MADYVQWSSVPKAKSGNGGEKGNYLKLESGKKYKVRPVFDPVQFYKYFHKKDGKLRTAICGDPNICSVRDKHPELKKPSLRFAAYIIDRADGKVKILEAPQAVFRPIGSSFEATGKNPGSGKDGSDWQITVNGKGLSTTYDVAFAGNTPLTPEERASVKEALEGDMQRLEKIYKVDTPKEIEEKLFGEWKKKEGSDSSEEDPDSFVPEVEEDVESQTQSTISDDFDNNW